MNKLEERFEEIFDRHDNCDTYDRVIDEVGIAIDSANEAKKIAMEFYKFRGETEMDSTGKYFIWKEREWGVDITYTLEELFDKFINEK